MSEGFPPTTARKKQHFHTLDFLRGVAALSVVLLHFSGSTIVTINPNYLTEYFSWGRLGVQVFFVISGFIIPYSMYVSNYSIKHSGKFLLKRMTRIGPPSWIAILMVIVLYYASIYLKGKPIEGMSWPGTDLKTIFANLTYTYNLIGAGKYIDVFWTLEVELQFYIIMAFLLPLLLYFKDNLVVFSIIILALNLTGFISGNRIIFFNNNGLFILGMLLFFYREKIISREYYIYSSMAIMMITYAQMELPYTFAGIIALLIIAFVNFNNPVASFMGKISYSLYITHFFVGTASEIILKNITGTELSDWMRIVMLIVYTGIAIGAAWVFYVVVEQPFINLSQKISWKKNKKKLPDQSYSPSI